MPSPHQFTYFQGGGFDVSLLSFLQIDREGSRQRLAARRPSPHVTAGAGGFVDITAQAQARSSSPAIFTAGAKLAVEEGRLRIEQEGKVEKLVPEVEHVSFSGRRARGAGPGDHLCHRALRHEADAAAAIVVTEIAPGVDLERDVLAQADFPLLPANDLKTMDEALVPPGADRPRSPGGPAMSARRP